MSGYDLKRAQSYFNLNKGVVYLNHASHPPMPIPCRLAYERFFDSWEKTAHNHDPESFRIFEELRGKLADFVCVPTERIGLSPHTTYGMNILASGIRWREGDNLVISEREFPASVYPWLRLRNKGVEIRFAKTRDGFFDEEALMAACDSRTRLIHTSWVQFNNGHRVDLGKLGKFCAARDTLFSVDGIQGTGVVPVNIGSLGIDMFTCGCQKWMLGPCGTGFYYLSEKAEAAIEPPYSGWLSVDWKAEFSDLMRYNLTPRTGPSKYEIGTYAFQDWRALNASVDIIRSFDRQQVWEHIRSLLDRLVEYLKSDERYRLVTTMEPNRRSGILTFKAENPKALYDYLLAKNFVISYRERAIRVSPHFYNSPDEIDKLIAALRDFSG